VEQETPCRLPAIGRQDFSAIRVMVSALARVAPRKQKLVGSFFGCGLTDVRLARAGRRSRCDEREPETGEARAMTGTEHGQT
jgi:hypothetical protein